jgi:hypothetical protein
MLADRWPESCLDLQSPAVRCRNGERRLFYALSKTVERYYCPTPYKTRHVAGCNQRQDWKQDSPKSLVYRNQTQPDSPGPILKCGWPRLPLGANHSEPLRVILHSSSTCQINIKGVGITRRNMAFVHHAYENRYNSHAVCSALRLLNLCSSE